jgi:hypothetical protein
MEITVNSCNTKPPDRDLNLQPWDPCSGTLATTPMKLIKNGSFYIVLFYKYFNE